MTTEDRFSRITALVLIELCNKKTEFVAHAFVFATQIVQSLCILNFDLMIQLKSQSGIEYIYSLRAGEDNLWGRFFFININHLSI